MSDLRVLAFIVAGLTLGMAGVQLAALGVTVIFAWLLLVALAAVFAGAALS